MTLSLLFAQKKVFALEQIRNGFSEVRYRLLGIRIKLVSTVQDDWVLIRFFSMDLARVSFRIRVWVVYGLGFRG